MSENEAIDLAFVFDTQDEALAQQFRAMFPDGEVTEADNFGGQISIAALLTVGKDVLASILGFFSARQEAISGSKVRFARTKDGETQEIALEGYSADQAALLLDKIKEMQSA